ncbi:hypothetical protein J3U96_18850 [Stenotrophomonas maltophilia]|nr:hypothetical protein J3U96_18850 [Stenotrophomonas maltophilia]
MNQPVTSAAQDARELLKGLPGWYSSLTMHRRLQGLMMLVAGLLLLILLIVPYNRQVLVIDLESAQPGRLQVYFDMGQGLSESLSMIKRYQAGQTELRYELPRGTLHGVRIDPDPGAAPIVFTHIGAVGFGGRERQTLADPLQLEGVQMARDTSPGLEHARFVIAADATDPQLAIPLAVPMKSNSGVAPATWNLLWWAFWLSLLVAISLQFLRRPMPLLALALIVLGLCTALSMFSPTSGRSVHPDELLHDADAGYFQHHWAPPRMDAADLATSFTSSPYGVTYLSEWNVVYLFAAKTSRIFGELGLDVMLSYRAFNLALFALMLVGLVVIRAPRGSYIPLLITPQLWYVFSYFNGDAMPFALGMLAATIALMPEGPLQRFLQRRGPLDAATLGHLLVFCTCLGLLLLSKKNYWPVAAFIALSMSVVALRLRALLASSLVVLLLAGVAANGAGTGLAAAAGSSLLTVVGIMAGLSLLYCFYAAWVLLRESHSRATIGRICLTLALSAAVALPWIAVDAYKHRGGPGKTALIEQQRERFAEPAFKPSVTRTLSAEVSGFKLQEKGVQIGQLLDAPKEWHVGTFRSFFGVYGYMEYFDTESAYRFVGWCVLGVLLLALAWGLGTRTLSPALAITSVGCGLALVLASFLHSWTYDFQPQGRYVMGLVVMMVPLFMRTGESQWGRVLFTAVALLLFVLSAASFTRIALPHLV